MKPTGTQFDSLMRDLEAATSEFQARIEDRALWPRGVPGKWTVGQHADHIATALAVTAHAFEDAEKELRAGRLGPPPGRGLPESLFVGLVVGRGWFPRGGRAPESIIPMDSPDRAEVMSRLAAGIARHRTLGERLDAGDQDRLWIRSPFMRGWHYRFPEIVRMHAVHTRHHAKRVAENAARSSR